LDQTERRTKQKPKNPNPATVSLWESE